MTDKTSARIERLEQNDKKRKRIFAVIIVLLIAIFLGGMIWGLSNILGDEGTYEFSDKERAVYALPDSGKGAVDLFTLMCARAADTNKVKYDIKTTLDIPQDSIATGKGDSEMAAVIKFVRGDVLNTLKGRYEEVKGEFGAEAKELPPVGTFSAQDTKLAACYRGECEEDGTPCLDDNGEQKNTQNYYFKFRFPEQPLAKPGSALYASFCMENVQPLIDELVSGYSNILTVNSLDIKCSGFAIDSDMNCVAGTLNYISYKRVYTVSANITFKGAYEAYGAHSVKFDFSANKEYFFANAGVVFEQSEISIEKGGNEQIMAAVTADEKIKLNWVSSNPEIVSVDDEGYLKGKSNSTESVTVTASFEYLGNTYTDSCTVHVRKAVDKIRISQTELKLKPGESAKLSAEVLPKRATEKGIIWICEKESVAVVDIDGTVYAVEPGAAEIIAVSKDGHYKATCILTVAE